MTQRIGIIGAGSFGAAHAQAIAALPDARLVAVCRTDPAALAQFTREYGGRGYLHYADLLADPEVDAVVIATPHHLHVEIAEQAAAAGKHILLEKPVAPDLAGTDRILAAAGRAGVKLMVSFTSHFIPAYRAAYELLHSGELGEVVMARSAMVKFWFEPNRRAWHLDRATGGGMWLTGGLHCLDRVMWLAGSPVRQVYAQLDTRLHRQAADDCGLVSLRFADGAMGSVVSVGYHTGAPDHLTELICTEGVLRIDHGAGLSIGRGESWQPVPGTASATWMAGALQAEWRAFVAALDGRGPVPVDGAYARRVMAVAFAAEESARQGRAIDL